jgi:hypothetical protein
MAVKVAGSYARWARKLFCLVFCGCCEEDEVPPKPVPPKGVWTLSLGTFSVRFQGEFQMMLPVDKSVAATASFVDAKGNPAVVEGVPVWGTDRPDLLAVTDNGDGSATVACVGPLGSGQVTCTGDADMGAGVVPVVLMGTIEVIAGAAVGGVINFGEPV